MQSILLAGRECRLWMPKQSDPAFPLPVVYANDGDMEEEFFDAVFKRMEQAVTTGVCRPFLFLAVPPLDRNREYVPWPALPLGKRGEPFTGGGEEYLRFLSDRLLPEAEQRLPVRTEPEHTALIGYSLGGLSALWSATQTARFGNIGSLSGSLWYDGFPGYLAEHPLCGGIGRVYLSLGSGEEKNRNPRMSAVGVNTRTAYAWIRERIPDSILEFNEGGHFNDVEGRFQKALLWLMRP